MNTTTCCKNCRWWNMGLAALGKPLEMPANVYQDNPPMVLGGRCQRYAPSGQGWITTREDDWCGDFYPSQNPASGLAGFLERGWVPSYGDADIGEPCDPTPKG